MIDSVRRINLVLAIAIATLIIAIITLSWVPPISKDALVHHLALPKLYLEHGSIYEIPSMPFSYFPMNLDLLYMIPLYYGNDIIPKLIHFSFALLTAWLLFVYLKRRMSRTYSLLGVLLFLSIPIIIKLSITVYVDLGVIFFSFASLFLILKWAESHFQIKYLIFSAIFCGLAMGSKYNGLVHFCILSLFVPFIYSSHKKNKNPGLLRPAGFCGLFIIISLLIFSPWMIRNCAWKGNPIYPQYNKIFNSNENPIKKYVQKKKSVEKKNHGFFTFRSLIYNETGWEIALLPIRIFFQGKDGSPQYFDGELNPFLILLPIFAFIRKRESPDIFRSEKMIMLAYVTLFFFFAFFTSVLRIRYISPIIPPLVVLSMFGVYNITGIVKKFHPKITLRTGLGFLILSLVFFLALNVHYIVRQFNFIKPLSYISGALTRDEYLKNYIPEYPAMQYINSNLEPDALILFVLMGKKGYYCERDYILGRNEFFRIVKRSDTPKAITLGLKKKGVTHILFNDYFFAKWVKQNLGQKENIKLRSFFNSQINVLYFKSGYVLCSIKQDSDRSFLK